VRRLSFPVLVLVVAGVVSGEAAALAKVQVPGVQVALYRHGYYKGPVDGISGPLTKRAIRDFQRSKGLEADGVVGRRTRAALGRLGRPLFGARLLKRGMAGFDVSVLQFLLAKRGSRPPSLDGTFGPVTERLVRRFQRRAGLATDGIVGKRTRAALLASGGGRPAVRGAGRLHVVRPGETLSGIAARAGTTVAALARRNRLDPNRFLLVGTKLVLPMSGGSATPASRGAVEASLGRWAAHYGISEDLVRALAWQESGFQNDVRSRAGAVGVMQVLPATRAFVEGVLIGEPVPRTMDGNVRLGVAYLHHLLHRLGFDMRLAVGAYYQGPASVQRRGLMRRTRHFVANVLALRGRV
jgi:Putative peptidoglycan binding domain/Transglycosylase SLT domain/LysM domain